MVLKLVSETATPRFHVRFRPKSSKVEHERLTELLLAGRGNVERGRELFSNAEKSLCFKCHRIGVSGGRIGPDLTGIGCRFSRIHLVEAILNSSRTIAPSYASMLVVLDNGRVLTGVKTAETPDSITLVDVAYPKSSEPLPAILSVHGGRWRGGHKRDTSTIKVEQWAGFGFFSMSNDYRLVGCTPAPACYQDLQCAIRCLHANSKELNIDTNRIFLMGQSAGGHMVSLAATLGDGPFPRTGGWEKASNDFRGVISLAANYELNTLSWGSIWTPATGDAVEARSLASPVNHVRKDMKPILILHSDNDRSGPFRLRMHC